MFKVNDLEKFEKIKSISEQQEKRIAELEEQLKVYDIAIMNLSNALVEENLPYEEIEEFKGEAGIESVGVDCEDVFYYFIWKAENELQEEAETKLRELLNKEWLWKIKKVKLLNYQ